MFQEKGKTNPWWFISKASGSSAAQFHVGAQPLLPMATDELRGDKCLRCLLATHFFLNIFLLNHLRLLFNSDLFKVQIFPFILMTV